ncbi:hypothetical protein [Streptomyces sp. NPDC093970]|uniref:HEAT repeat domain-containing protein n=1 Tax=Streptomyces sp. NPDC093970 TaxID=3155076 RepID=UPI00343D1408
MPEPTVEALIGDLDSDDTAIRVAARDALQQRGISAVAPLMRALTGPASERALSMYTVTLQRLGRSAFSTVVNALASEAESDAQSAVTKRLSRVLRGFRTDCMVEYVGELHHDSPVVRAAAAGSLGCCGSAALPYAVHLLPLLADADRQVRDSTTLALSRLSADVAPMLSQVRRGGPGGLRRGALTVLADLIDPRELDPADQAAIRRLINIKQLDDSPQPFTACFLAWIAVRTGDQAGLLDLLELSDPEPATFVLGATAADSDSHDFQDGPPYPQYARVFVTPELDGWTLVVGRWCSPIDEERSDHVAHMCQELSAHYGAAQAYFFGAQNDGSAWLVAEHGAIIRRGASDDEGAADDPEWEIGEPLPFEQQERDRLIAEGGDVEFEWEFALLEMAPKLAGALSINPLEVGATTPARGRGVLALTPYGAVHGVPPGALPI